MASRVSISVLGELRVQRDGQPVTLPPSKKTRALLAYLAVVQRPQRRERLCEIFWQIPDDPRGALRWSLSRIRQIVDAGGEGCLRADRNFVVLDAGRFDCDFRPILGLKAEQIDTLDVARMEALAESIYGGFLEDLYLSNCPEFEAWRVAEAEQVEMIRLRLLRALVDRLGGQPERALRHAHVLHALAPEPSLAEEIERLAAQARHMAAAASSQQPAQADPMAAAGPPPAAAERGQQPPATASQTRRQVSVLAAEIAAPLQSHEEDPEAGIAFIKPLVGKVHREVERCGGSVISSTDASVVAIFGAGLATEDHAFQACRAALAIKAGAETEGDTAVRLSIGLDTGETVLRPIASGGAAQIEVHGAVVRNARRLAQMLRRDAIASTARMNDALFGYVAAAAMSDADFSGGQPAGECYEILGRSRASTRWQLRRARGLAPLTGRAAELATLGDAWQRVRAGAGQCVGVVGDAGIGKSRLVYEFLTSAAVSDCRIVEVGALEFDAITSLHIVKKLLRTILDIEEGDDAPAAAAKVAAGIASLGADPSLGSPVLFALDIPPDDREWMALPVSEHVRRVRNAASVMLALTAKARPLVVLVEDLHWIDADSASVLDRLIDSIATRQILLLMTFRPDYHHAWGSRSNYSQLRLDPLPRGEAESLLRVLLGDDSSVSASASLIAERTDGVPLFIEETVQALAQSGALNGAPGAYIAAGRDHRPARAGDHPIRDRGAHRPPGAERATAAAECGHHRSRRLPQGAGLGRRARRGGGQRRRAEAAGRGLPLRDAAVSAAGVHLQACAGAEGRLRQPGAGRSQAAARAADRCPGIHTAASDRRLRREARRARHQCGALGQGGRVSAALGTARAAALLAQPGAVVPQQGSRDPG